jgi:hypothetical protein
VLAYAFLAEGAREPLSGFVWPTPGEGEPGPWVDADTAPGEWARGYPATELPYWLDDELWRIELAGMLSQRDHLFVAERARLLDRIDTWTEQLAWEFAAACAWRVADQAAALLREDGRADEALRLERARDLGELELAASSAAREAEGLAGYVADVCFYARDAGAAARGACVAAKMSAFALAGGVENVRGYDERLAAERAWQSSWLVDRLGLSSSA